MEEKSAACVSLPARTVAGVVEPRTATDCWRSPSWLSLVLLCCLRASQYCITARGRLWLIEH